MGSSQPEINLLNSFSKLLNLLHDFADLVSYFRLGHHAHNDLPEGNPD